MLVRYGSLVSVKRKQRGKAFLDLIDNLKSEMLLCHTVFKMSC